jgi:hypothetical protein
MTRIERFLADIADVPVATDAPTLKLKSRDFFWFSPILKRELEDKRALAVVRPRDREELKRVVSAAAKRRVALTMRGGGTGNYGQCVPLDGGVVLDMTGLDRVIAARPGLVSVEAGAMMLDIDKALKPMGWELRFFPSTRANASIGGFVCGGAGGVGSCTWGQIGDAGAVQAATILTMEEEPRTLRLEGPEVMKIVHAYGINGIVLDLDLPTAPRQPWMEVVVTFADLAAATRFGQTVTEDQVLSKKLVSIHQPGISRYLKRLAPMIPVERAFAILMVCEAQRTHLEAHVSAFGGNVVYTRDAEAAEAAAFGHNSAMPPLYEYTWNHTTLHAMRVDPSITYLQVLFPLGKTVETVLWANEKFAGEIEWHLEFQRRFSGITCSSLCLVKYQSDERLMELISLIEAGGARVSNPHIYTIEGKGWKRIKADQEGFKTDTDPHFLLNPGRLPTLEAEFHARQTAAE